MSPNTKITGFSDEAVVLPRPSHPVDPGVFKKLYDLNRECPWLEIESDALIELWNLCDSQEQEDLISDLLKRFELVDSHKLLEYGRLVADKIALEWNLDPEKTRIIAVSDDSDADGSQAFLQSLKNKFAIFDNWSEKCFVNNITTARNNAKDDWTYVLLDDFFGTGRTIERKVKWFINELKNNGKKNVTVKAIAIGGMLDSQKKLTSLGIDYFCPVWLEKGMSGHYKTSNLSTLKTEMLNLEGKLEKYIRGLRLSTFSLGFMKSEALFCVHAYNVPNNVFPIFWWPKLKKNQERKTIFLRLR